MCVLFLLLSIFFKWDCDERALAFPGAEGYGKYATGGRGGRVVFVTNLQDDGQGSFRQAFQQYPGEPITIIFTVSGLITLKSDIKVNRSDISIAGQTAPGDGICLNGYSLKINGAASGSAGNHGNIIIRYLRARPGRRDPFGQYGIDIENCHDVIVDHCSFSWANEECAAIYDTKNITIQWCIISEGLYNAGHKKGNRSYCGVWGGQYSSFHHNLIANNRSRTVRFNGSRSHDTIAVIDFQNNLIFNWGTENACYGGEVNISNGRSVINLVNNLYIPGPATPSIHKFLKVNYTEGKSFGNNQIFIFGNVMEGESMLDSNNQKGVDLTELPETLKLSVFLNGTYPIAVPVPIQPITLAYKDILKHAGANTPKRDAVDKRVTEEVISRTCTASGTFSKPGIIDDPVQVGGWPNYHNGKTLQDSDQDGIPDKWELEHFLNPHDPNESNQHNKQGYTWLEVYLNSFI
ncbi:pectate lyase family protein [Mucilaginibacter pocheonensis]|uniref:Pectate lyase n=1 Tax=Mucilaginibacter pocheonensis TaxID=398050 RepID=A0ABU1TCA5_9SPHI|nr:pectate lyase [Mucilaginibacter pocheonensis]MDR6942944.1 hypothetical protein [Mucilaginibacter pocheonensis]